MNILNKINGPKDLKKLSIKELNELSSELRQAILDTVSKNGGHLAPCLGAVELIAAIHYTFDSPKDKILFDVGHQAYAHKLLTGRRDQFANIRKLGGISGYLKILESEHDAFGAGHVGTAVSAGLGIAKGRDLSQEKFEVVAVVGDGAMTNGMTLEGLNNAGELNTNITVILNDNEYSISKNIGGLAKHFSNLKNCNPNDQDFFSIFHGLGFSYFGPIDGHDIEKLVEIFEATKAISGPKLIHVVTKKGKGYEIAERAPTDYHATLPFDPVTGQKIKNKTFKTYTEAFVEELIKLAEKDEKIVAITAAMPDGTGLTKFAEKFPDRFFDVGIAESHAVTFAAGLATQGLKPVFAVYSSFLQRGYDQVLHDVCLQNIPVVFCLDRAGIVGDDGPTHHGLFDYSYLRNIPNLIVLAPKDENEVQSMLKVAIDSKQPVTLRYPRSAGFGMENDSTDFQIGKAQKLRAGKDLTIIAAGTMVYPSLKAAQILNKNGLDVAVFNSRSIKPLDQEMIKEAAKTKFIVTVEENVLDGGFGGAILEELEKLNLINHVIVKRIGINGFVEHGTIDELKEKNGLSAEKIAEKIGQFINKKAIIEQIA